MAQGGLGNDQNETGGVEPAKEGRPSDTAPATPGDTGRPSLVREGNGDSATEPDATVAPEERGEEPETEHAPGSDL